MALPPGVNGPIHVCRRLFGEVTCSKVQQTLEAIIRKDTERFTKIWNFPLIARGEDPRQPLSHKNQDAVTEVRNTDALGVPQMNWQLIQPEASFYTTPPRRLKAYRRLTPSVARKTQMELLNLRNGFNRHPVNDEVVRQLHPAEENTEEKQNTAVELNQPLRNADVPPCSVAASAKPNTPRTPILVRTLGPDGCLHSPYLGQVMVSGTLNPEPSAAAPTSTATRHCLTLVRGPRYSEQSHKRGSAKVTDYFKIRKRLRTSLK
ncbi:unnamed protein product [Dicrocoelium dendriticum]|nr:unnamed protein product [Dicrocoelium dendriticum]